MSCLRGSSGATLLVLVCWMQFFPDGLLTKVSSAGRSRALGCYRSACHGHVDYRRFAHLRDDHQLFHVLPGTRRVLIQSPDGAWDWWHGGIMGWIPRCFLSSCSCVLIILIVPAFDILFLRWSNLSDPKIALKTLKTLDNPSAIFMLYIQPWPVIQQNSHVHATSVKISTTTLYAVDSPLETSQLQSNYFLFSLLSLLRQRIQPGCSSHQLLSLVSHLGASRVPVSHHAAWTCILDFPRGYMH